MQEQRKHNANNTCNGANSKFIQIDPDRPRPQIRIAYAYLLPAQPIAEENSDVHVNQVRPESVDQRERYHPSPALFAADVEIWRDTRHWEK